MRIRQHRLVVVAVVAACLVAGGAFAVPRAASRPAAARAAATRPTTHTPVMGPNLLSADQLARWYNHMHGSPPRAPGAGNDIHTLAQLFIEEGRTEGVRGDLAFVQSVLETGWFSFPDNGQIRPFFNNFAGMYAFNGRATGTTCAAETVPSRCFPSARIGVRAQMQLLRGYADATTRGLKGRLAHPPSERIGVAPIWELFGGSSGQAIWATAPNYGIVIIRLYSDALVYNGARSECLPYSPGSSLDQSGKGYWVVGSDGGVQSFGAANFFGSAGNLRLRKPVVGGESTPTGRGYWLVATDGGVFSYGGAKFHGSTGNIRLVAPVLGMERTQSGNGYWMAAFDGGVFAFGDAPFHGSMGGRHLNQPVLGMERTSTGNGYYLFASDGGLFSFGDAKFYGSLGNRHIPAPIVSMQRTRTGRGYWMLSANGTVYAFGDAKSFGNIAGCGFPSAARLLVSPTGRGYWIETVDGTVVALGDARRHGFPARIDGTAVALMLRP
jgi:hypothetical protein